MARATAARSSASSVSVELTNTRRRWSGVRIAALLPFGSVIDPSLRYDPWVPTCGAIIPQAAPWGISMCGREFRGAGEKAHRVALVVRRDQHHRRPAARDRRGVRDRLLAARRPGARLERGQRRE